MKKHRRPKGSGAVFFHEGRQLWTAIVEQTPQVVAFDDRHRPIKKRLRKQIYGKSKTTVMQRLKVLLRESGQTSNSKDGRLSLSEYLDRWLGDVSVESRQTTHASYEVAVRKHIVPHLGAVRIDKLSPEAVRSWIQSLRKDDVGARTMQLAYIVLKSALESAVDAEIIAKNPCKGVPRPKYEAEERAALEAGDLRKLLTAARGSRYEAAIALAIGTGARQGEILGLRWRNVDFERGMLAIETQLQGGKSAQLKTKAARRNVPLPAFCIKALKEHRRRAQGEGHSLKPDAFVFVGETGRPLDRHNFTKRVFAPIVEKAKLEDVTFHQLRHSWATLQSELGLPVRDMSAMLGHSKTSVTMDVYAHQASEAQRKGSEALNRLLEGRKP